MDENQGNITESELNKAQKNITGSELNKRKENITESELNKAMEATLYGKSAVITFVLWFFLGYLGVHRMYVGKIGSGIAMMALTIIGFFTIFILIGFLLLAIVSVWYWVDLVLMIIELSKKK